MYNIHLTDRNEGKLFINSIPAVNILQTGVTIATA